VSVSWLRLIVGIAWFALGAVYVLGRHRIEARHVRRLGRLAQGSTVWAVLGSIYLLLGALWLVMAFL
jgi:hypothetical protein